MWHTLPLPASVLSMFTMLKYHPLSQRHAQTAAGTQLGTSAAYRSRATISKLGKITYEARQSLCVSRDSGTKFMRETVYKECLLIGLPATTIKPVGNTVQESQMAPYLYQLSSNFWNCFHDFFFNPWAHARHYLYCTQFAGPICNWQERLNMFLKEAPQ